MIKRIVILILLFIFFTCSISIAAPSIIMGGAVNPDRGGNGGGFLPPKLPCLWGWFKFDEGVGNTIIDYSPVLVNGCWFDNAGGICCVPPPPVKHWSVAGFGHNDNIDLATSYFRRVDPAGRSSRYMSLIAFVRPLDLLGGTRYAILGGETGGTNNIAIGWTNNGAGEVLFHIMGGDPGGFPFYSVNSYPLNAWYFIYAYSSNEAGTDRVKMYIRPVGGALSLEVDNIPLVGVASTHTAVYDFGTTGYGYVMDGGDIFYWVGDTVDCIADLADADEVYNYLVSRY